MKVLTTAIDGVVILEPEVFGDVLGDAAKDVLGKGSGS